jgi:CheY-like chemotaxis protein
MVSAMSETNQPKDPPPDSGMVIGDRSVLKRDLRDLRQLRAREQMTASMVHDFNNLLTAITCSSALLEEDVERGSRAASMVHEIQEAAERAVMLVRKMLGSPKSVDPSPPADVGAIVGALRPLLGRVVGPEIGIDVSLDRHAGFAAAPKDELEQVLINLATNARHAMPNGGRLGVSASRVNFDEIEAVALDCPPGAYVALQVIDTGVGMTAEVRERALEANFTTRGDAGGQGLGFASAHRFAAECGGTIAIWSEPGEGTAVTLYLPAIDVPIEIPPGAADLMPRGSETILVVEADEAVRRVVCTVLEQLGYMVLDAISGEDALGLAQDYMSPIHLVLTDVALPDLDGRDLAPRFEALGRSVRLLAMTGHAETLAPRPGEVALPVLRKAFSAIELAQKIREVLDLQ